MKNIKLFSVILTLLLPSYAQSNDLSLKLKGSYDFQMGYIKSNRPSDYKKISSLRNHYAFNSTAYLGFDAKNELDSGLIYGAKIGVETTARSARNSPSSLYFQTEAGKTEFGTEKSAAAIMKISPITGSWDTWVRGDATAATGRGAPFVQSFSNFLDIKMRSPGKTEYSRKITYYTPKFNGIQFGVSYIPDSSNVGYTSINDSSINHTPMFSEKYFFNVKNGLAGGVTYDKKMSQDFKFKLSVVGEHGKVKPKAKSLVSSTVKFKDLNYMTTGAEFVYLDYTFKLAYSDYFKSMTSVSDANRNTNLYGSSLKYNFTKKFSATAAYFVSNHRSNKVNNVTLACDYKLQPGLQPYAEVTYFRAKGRRLSDNINVPKREHKGAFFLLGTKLVF